MFEKRHGCQGAKIEQNNLAIWSHWLLDQKQKEEATFKKEKNSVTR